jgi:hypothetical protein
VKEIGTLYDEAAGRRSRSALVAMGAFWAGLIKFILSGAMLKIWGQTIEFSPVDAGLLVAFMGPCFALYWGRRYTDALRGVGVPPPAADNPAAEKAE